MLYWVRLDKVVKIMIKSQQQLLRVLLGLVWPHNAHHREHAWLVFMHLFSSRKHRTSVRPSSRRVDCSDRDLSPFKGVGIVAYGSRYVSAFPLKHSIPLLKDNMKIIRIECLRIVGRKREATEKLMDLMSIPNRWTRSHTKTKWGAPYYSPILYCRCRSCSEML